MAQRTSMPRPAKGSDKFGGYSGSKPAAQMPPPAKIPSSFPRPVPAASAKGAARPK
jgi:hypothetical protein